MRRFYASPENFTPHRVILDLEQSRHLRSVLRLTEGDEIQVFDGAGNEFLCEIEKIEKKQTSLKIRERRAPFAPESDLDLTLAIAVLKGEKFDLVIQKAVELGIINFVPMITKRGDVKPKNFDKKIERFEKIIIESSKQCGRATLMRISEPIDFEEFIATATGAKILFSERNGKSFSEINSDKKITAVIGSEGGWEDAEIELARQNDFQIITLGGRILRAETAAISITTLLQHNFGDLR
jgi:16S rRNA (uracil1498-N3)-methyltransferase